MAIKISKNADVNWKRNEIQFPRLIAELEAAGAFTGPVMDTLMESMDLTADQLDDLVSRSQDQWDQIKRHGIAL